MIEVLKQMQEALREYHYYTIDAGLPNQSMLNKGYAAFQAGKQAIKELESQEPVAWRYALDASVEGPRWIYIDKDPHQWLLGPAMAMAVIEKLYTRPPQRTWVGLTDDDDIDWEEGGNLKDLVKAIEAKLKQKNGFTEENT